MAQLCGVSEQTGPVRPTGHGWVTWKDGVGKKRAWREGGCVLRQSMVAHNCAPSSKHSLHLCPCSASFVFLQVFCHPPGLQTSGHSLVAGHVATSIVPALRTGCFLDWTVAQSAVVCAGICAHGTSQVLHPMPPPAGARSGDTCASTRRHACRHAPHHDPSADLTLPAQACGAGLQDACTSGRVVQFACRCLCAGHLVWPSLWSLARTWPSIAGNVFQVRSSWNADATADSWVLYGSCVGTCRVTTHNNQLKPQWCLVRRWLGLQHHGAG